MDSKIIKQYFNDYVKSYIPYKNNNVFKAFIDFFSNDVVEQWYMAIPDIFKDVFINNQIPIDILDHLLIAVGLPLDVIKKLSNSDKLIFIKSVSDFQKYKGSIKLFKNIIKSYNNNFDVYELYTDKDSSLGWVLKPVLIYKGNNESQKPENIQYDEAYKTIPSLLINETQLDSLYDNKNALFPIKTNILLLYYNISIDVNIFINYKIATFLVNQQDVLINIYLGDQIFFVSLPDIYMIWHYLLMLKHGTTKWINEPIMRYLFSKNNIMPSSVNIDLNKVLDLENEFNDLEFTHQVQQKIEETFNLNFLSDTITYEEIQKNEIKISLQAKYPFLINYIISNQSDIDTFFSDIYNSVHVYVKQNITDVTLENFYDLFLRILNQVIISPKKSTSYLLLHNLKPYHVELLNKSIQTLNGVGIFNIMRPDDKVTTSYELLLSDFLNNTINMIDEKITFEIYKNVISNFKNSDFFESQFNLIVTSDFSLNEKLILILELFKTNIIALSDSVIFDTDLYKSNDININDKNTMEIFSNFPLGNVENEEKIKLEDQFEVSVI